MEEEIRKLIEISKDRLPLSYNDVVYKKDNNRKIITKTIKSEYYRDTNYVISKPFKKISRLL